MVIYMEKGYIEYKWSLILLPTLDIHYALDRYWDDESTLTLVLN
jgi:hypothetical protein